MTEIPKHPPLEYSVSRQKMFDECCKKWWYRYVGSWGGWAAERNSEHRRIWLYGKAEAPIWKLGKIVHEGIAEALAGPNSNRSGIVERARRKLDTSLTEAANWSEDLADAHKMFFLIDNVLRKPQPNGIMIEDFKDDISDFLGAFFEHRGNGWLKGGFIEAVRHANEDKRHVHIETQRTDFDKAKFTDPGIAGGRVPIWAIPDFIIEYQRARYLIIDWKTGEANAATTEPEYQLRIYGLRFALENRIDASSIDLYEFHLPERTWSGGAFSKELFEKTRDELDSAATRLIAMRGDDAAISEGKCAPTGSARACRQCCYSPLCKSSRAGEDTLA